MPFDSPSNALTNFFRYQLDPMMRSTVNYKNFKFADRWRWYATCQESVHGAEFIWYSLRIWKKSTTRQFESSWDDITELKFKFQRKPKRRGWNSCGRSGCGVIYPADTSITPADTAVIIIMGRAISGRGENKSQSPSHISHMEIMQ